jgi:hypothetical protein
MGTIDTEGETMKMQDCRIGLVIMLMMLAAGSALAAENVYQVGSGQPYTTIQSALDAARQGNAPTDTQIVRIMDSSSSYTNEELMVTNTWTTRKLVLEASEGQTPTLYRIRLAGTIAEVTLKGLKFKSSKAGATVNGGVEITQNNMGVSKPVTITNCIFEQTGNVAGSGWLNGVYLTSSTSNSYGKVTVAGCTFDMTAGSTSLQSVGVTISPASSHFANAEVKECVFLGGYRGVNDANLNNATMVALNIHNNLFHSQNYCGSQHAVSNGHTYVTLENNTFVKIFDRVGGFGHGGAIGLRNEPAFAGVIRDNLIVDDMTNVANAGIGWFDTTPTSCNADTNAFVAMTANKVAAWGGTTANLKTITDLNGLTGASGNFENDTLAPADLFANYGGTDYRNDYRLKPGAWALTNASDGSYVGAFGVERPTVTVTANDAAADEAGPDNGQFTISRGSRTDGALTVNYTLPTSGSATPGNGEGGDYTTTPAANYGARTGSVTIPDTATNVTVTVTPVDDGDTELPETVVLLLATSADYNIGSPASNLVTIADNDVGGNMPPVVSAGANKTVVSNSLPALTGLEGNATDLDNGPTSPMTYQWSKVTGPGTVTFGNAADTNTTASFDTAGSYVLRLSAYDGAATASNTVEITIFDNEPPTVSAGADQSPTLATTVNLDGTVTVDDGLPTSPGLTYLWTQDSGPGTATFGNSSNIDTTVTFDQMGTYVLKLTATDGLGLSGSDTVTITVRDIVTFTAITNGRFNAVTTWDAPGGAIGPPLVGDTANITNWTVETLSASEVQAASIVNLSGTGILRCKDSGAILSPFAATATNNVSAGGTLRIDNNNNLVGTINLNGGRLMQQTGGEVAAGATLNVNADSEIAAVAVNDRCRILAPVHGGGKLTVTGNPGSIQGYGFTFAAGSTWSGAWDIRSGTVRMSTSQALPGDLRIASTGTVSHSDTGMTIKGVRSGSGSNVVYQAGVLTVGNGTTNIPGRGWWSPGDIGVNEAVGLATFGNDINSDGFSPTLRFASNSTFVVDIRGVSPDLYDRTVAFGMGTGTGKVQIVNGAILTVNLWTPPTQVTLNAKIIDTRTGTGGDGVLTGSFSQTNWVNAGGWQNLGVTVVDNDLYVTGERRPSGMLLWIQ